MSWDTVEEQLDIPRLLALSKYWRDHPPLHLMVAAYLGIKPKQRTFGAVNDPAEIAALIGALQQGHPPYGRQ